MSSPVHTAIETLMFLSIVGIVLTSALGVLIAALSSSTTGQRLGLEPAGGDILHVVLQLFLVLFLTFAGQLAAGPEHPRDVTPLTFGAQYIAFGIAILLLISAGALFLRVLDRVNRGLWDRWVEAGNGYA